MIWKSIFWGWFFFGSRGSNAVSMSWRKVLSIRMANKDHLGKNSVRLRGRPVLSLLGVLELNDSHLSIFCGQRGFEG